MTDLYRETETMILYERCPTCTDPAAPPFNPDRPCPSCDGCGFVEAVLKESELTRLAEACLSDKLLHGVVLKVAARADGLQLIADEQYAAVKEHRDQRGTNRCHLDDPRLYHRVLGDEPDPYATALPPDEDMIQDCLRYIRQRQNPEAKGRYPMPCRMTITQMTDAVVRLRAIAQAVIDFYHDHEAFGDFASLTSCAGAFAPIYRLAAEALDPDLDSSIAEQIPGWMIYAATRFVLSRTGSAPSEPICRWLLENWPAIPAETRRDIRQAVEDALEADTRSRRKFERVPSDGPIGPPEVRLRWEEVRALWKPLPQPVDSSAEPGGGSG